MMLCKLSLGNIKKSFKDYAIYFFTLILGVAVFYIFNAIDSQTIMLEVTSSTREIIKLMTSMLSGVSVFVSFVLGFLIIYASRFLMKRRHHEFGIYMTLGMGKGSISKILLFETLLIGCISLLVGLGLGIMLSQVMSIFVANMFEANLTKFTFIVSVPAIIKTIGYFGIMYLIVMIFNTISVSKCKLIDLIYSNKKTEKVRLKNPILCVLIFIVSSCFLGYAYYMVTATYGTLETLIIPIALGCVTTFFIFWSLSGLLLRIVMSLKNFYYKGINSFTFRQISSKINTTVMSMSVICIMLFLTICVLSSALSLKNSLNANINELAPVDIQLMKSLDMNETALEDGYSIEQIEDSKISIDETLEKLNFDSYRYFKDAVDVTIYATNELTVKDSLGAYYETSKNIYPTIDYTTAESIISLTDYNKIAKLFHKEEISLNENEYAVVADYDSWVDIRNESLKLKTPISLNGKEYVPKYEECIDGFVYISSNHINAGLIVVSDSVVQNLPREQEVLTANYNASNEEAKNEIEEKILALNEEAYASNTTISGSTKISIKEASTGLGAMVTFIGIYLGIIFLISSAALLALKELSESADNKNRYRMLRKIGVDEKMIRKSLFTQIAVFFLAPLLLACIHSIFGIKFCNLILNSMGTDQLLGSILMTAGVLIFIYGGYFLITYYCSKWMIEEK